MLSDQVAFVKNISQATVPGKGKRGKQNKMWEDNINQIVDRPRFQQQSESNPGPS